MKGIYMLFIVTEILCYIFAILFPPPNKSLPQIESPFPYQLLSRLSLSMEPRVFLFLLPACLAHFAQSTGSPDLAHLLVSAAGPTLSHHPPGRSAEAALSQEPGMRGRKGQGLGCWGWPWNCANADRCV